MRIRFLGQISFFFALVLVLSMNVATAESSFFNSQCAGCHQDDTPTCNGCHMHRGSLHATADQTSYHPGDPVVVRLTGGSQHGWIRAILYDEGNTELTRAAGPTGTGDDGQGNAVVFPVALTTTAPSVTGDHVWEAAWYGNNNGSGHIERRTPVTIHVVEPPADVPEDPPQVNRTWGRIRAHYR